MKSIIVVVSGPALIGKSTFIEKLSSQVNGMIVSTDTIRKLLFGNYEFITQREPAVWKAFHDIIYRNLHAGEIIFLDATMRTKRERDNIYSLYKDFDIIYCAFEEVKLDILLERNKLRTWKQFDPEIVEKIWKTYEYPDAAEINRYKAFFHIPLNYNSELLEKIRIKIIDLK